MPSNHQVEEIWQELARKYNWQYVSNAATIISQTIAWCETEAIHDPKLISNRLKAEYSAQLHNGLQQQHENAAAELLQACIQAGRKYKPDSCSPEEFEDHVAQIVLIVITKLNNINPQTFLSYAFTCIRNAFKVKGQNYYSYDEQRDDVHGANDQTIDQIEQQMVETAVIELLRQTLTKQHEFEIIYRSFFLDEKPTPIARDLGLKPEEVRLSKSRSLEKLRKNPQAMQVFEQLLVNS